MWPRTAALVLSLVLGAAVASGSDAAAGQASGAPDTRLTGSVSAVGAAAEGDVRRWEHVILVRVDPSAPGTIGRAELAASRAGGAVLDDMRWEATASHEDYRFLVRTRSPDAVIEVLRAVRTTRGVLGATSVALPETPTYAGGPGFLESYRAPEDSSPGNADRVLMRHDVPPVADKKELLEMADILTPPSTGPDGAGGFTLNVSELFSRMKESAWRRREDRLRNTPIEILPSPSQGGGSLATP